MQKGFRRTALSLIIIALVTAGVAAVYLYFNFNSRSNLPLIVPSDANWFYHFQTREIKRKAKGDPPVYFDSLLKTVRKLPVLQGVADAGEPGLALYSDLVLFETADGWYAGLTVSSEDRLKTFCSGLKDKGMGGTLIQRPGCYYLKASGRNLYFAFRHKACVFFVPSDTAENALKAEAALDKIFTDKPKPLINEKEIQQLYDMESDVVFWSRKPSNLLTHGVSLKSGFAVFNHLGTKPGATAPSPLMLFTKAGLTYKPEEIGTLMDEKNRMGTNEYLNQTFRAVVQFLKPFNQ